MLFHELYVFSLVKSMVISIINSSDWKGTLTCITFIKPHPPPFFGLFKTRCLKGLKFHLSKTHYLYMSVAYPYSEWNGTVSCILLSHAS